MLRLVLAIALIASTLSLASCGGGSPAAPAPSATSFQGVWEGSWTRTGCSETGGAVGQACNQTPQSGALRLTFTQADNTVQGNVEFGSFVIPATGTVSGSNLTVSGQTHLPQPNATATVSNWSTTRTGNSMTGTFTFRLVADDPAFGSQTLQLALQNVTKSS
jgi:hypothetical protein